MDELRKQAADLILDRLKDSNVANIASKLGISRQAVYDIKKGKYCPSLSLVQKACDVWSVQFSFRGVLIDSTSFVRNSSAPVPPTPIQPTLFDFLEQLDNRNFEVVQTKPMGRALEITLRLTLPKQRTAGSS